MRTAIERLDYWIGVSECVCDSEYPIGGCMLCDLKAVRAELTGSDPRAKTSTEECDTPAGDQR